MFAYHQRYTNIYPQVLENRGVQYARPPRESVYPPRPWLREDTPRMGRGMDGEAGSSASSYRIGDGDRVGRMGRKRMGCQRGRGGGLHG